MIAPAIADGKAMYRTSSGRETALASMIRKLTAAPCWRQETDASQPHEKTLDGLTSPFAPTTSRDRSLRSGTA